MKIDILAPAALAAAMLTLTACGGNGDSPTAPAFPPLVDAERIQALTGSLPPAESGAAQGARAAGILGRADSLVVSSLYADTAHPQLPTLTIRSSCEGTTCVFREPRSGASVTTRLSDLEFDSSSNQGISLTRNGITLREGFTDAHQAYGAWMQYTAFAVYQQAGTISSEGTDYRYRARYGIAGGDLTGSLPTGISATWRGVMVGTPAQGDLAGHVLQGDATLTYGLSAGDAMLDAAFTNIKDLVRFAAHSVESVRFDDVPVRGDGTFGAGSTGNLIQGGFYGPEQAEAAGVFERSDIVGAFGAIRGPAFARLMDAERIRTLTESSPPVESGAAQDRRATGILERADSLTVSNLYGNIVHPRHFPLTIHSSCEGTTCVFREPGTGISETARLSDVTFTSSTGEEIGLTKNGITLHEGAKDRIEDYGAWMQHAVFALYEKADIATFQGTDYDYRARYGIAGGDLTGSLPTGISATWRGVMVGTPAQGDLAGHVLQGDATLTYGLSAGDAMLDAAFTNIKNLNLLAAHSVETVRFDDVPVQSGGTFGTGSTGNLIQGGFYGPEQVEAAGVFERSNIVGAFGAIKAP